MSHRGTAQRLRHDMLIPKQNLVLNRTGERLLPWDPHNPQNLYEHLQRYDFASQFCAGKRVLDVGSGEGYGSNMLATVAESVIGIDLAPDATQWAARKYGRANLKFVCGSGTAIPLGQNSSFDVAVCFELLEHIEEQDVLLVEIKRLLKPNGILILSTPNRSTYSDEPGYKNPFHKKELYFPEFCKLVGERFSDTVFLGQRVYTGASMWPLRDGNAEGGLRECLLRYDSPEFAFANPSERTAMYFIAVGSNSLLSRGARKLCSSHFALLDLTDTIFKRAEQEHNEAVKYQDHLHAELERQRGSCQQKEAESALLSAESENLKADIENLKADIEKQNADIESLIPDAHRWRRLRQIRQKIIRDNSSGHHLWLGARQLAKTILFGRARTSAYLNPVISCEFPPPQGISSMAGTVCVRGWTVYREKIRSVLVYLDDILCGEAYYGFARPDVANSYPDCGNNVHLGFAYRLDSSKYSHGVHRLRIVAAAADGKECSVEMQVAIIEKGDQLSVSTDSNHVPRGLFPDISSSDQPSKQSEATSAPSPGPPVDVSIIVLARNEASNLERSLPILSRQKTSAHAEIIAFDTESEDRTPELFSQYGARTVTVSKKEFHHVRTRMQGVEMAKGRFVVFLVADGIPADENWLDGLLRPLLEDERVAAVYSRQLPNPGCVPWEARDIYRGGNVVREVKFVEWDNSSSVTNFRDNVWKLIAFSHVSACYRKSVLQTLTVPDTLPEVEDQYWCKRLLEAGYRVVFEPTSLVVHSHNDTLRRLYRRQYIYGLCFAQFTPVDPEPLYKVLFRCLEDTFADWFFIVATPGSVWTKSLWAFKTPLARLIKPLGFRNGLRVARDQQKKQSTSAGRSMEAQS
jgi:SAM-dependent methyltransferase/GT2 family glycosyltransferase